MKRNSLLVLAPIAFFAALFSADTAWSLPAHVKLIDRLGAAIDGEALPVLPDDHFLMLDRESSLPTGAFVGKTVRGTPNFQAMAWAAEYLRVWRGGALPGWIKPAQGAQYRDFWRAKALEYFTRERARGLMGKEQMCADPHHNFHVAAAAAIRLGALEFHHQELIDASGRYFRDLFAVYAAVATPDGSICMASARVKRDSPPCTEVGSMIYRTVHGLPQQGVAANDESQWKQTYWAAARAVRRLVRQGDDLGGAAKMRSEDLAGVALAYPMRVERYADRVRTSILKDPGPFFLREEFASSTEIRFSPTWLNFRKLRRAGLLTFVKSWATPLPAVSPPQKPLLTVTSAAAPGD